MNTDTHTYVIYDKSSAHYHSFHNSYTINVTLDYLQIKNIPFISGEEAVKIFNDNVEDLHKIKEKLDFEIYNFRYYTFADIELSKVTDELIIGIIVIDNAKFEKYYVTHNSIPNEEFIKEVLRFHKQYKLEYKKYINIKQVDSEKTNKELIIDNALEPKNKILCVSGKQPSCIAKKFTLKPHQYKNLKWWTNTEKHPAKIYYNPGKSHKIQLGNIFYDFRLDTFSHMKTHPYVKFSGGMLIDVVGTGKTLSAIISSVKNPAKHLKYIHKGRINSGATLIITPSQVSKQWVREIGRFINPKKLELCIYAILGKIDLDKRTYQDLLDADFVITSQSFWNNNNFTKLFLPSTFKKTYMSSPEYDIKTVDELFDVKRKMLCENPEKLEDTSPLLPVIDWNRIIVDEIHEPYTDPKLVFMKNILNHLNGKHKWGLSGTPFDKGDCINEFVKFVLGKQLVITDEFYKNKAIYDYCDSSSECLSRYCNL